MRKLMFVALTGLMMTLVPARAGAQPPNATVYCMPASPNVCFAAGFAMTSHDVFTLWLQNVQGAPGTATEQYNLNQADFTRLVDTHAIHNLDLTTRPSLEGDVRVFHSFNGFEGSSVPSNEYRTGTIQFLDHRSDPFYGCTLAHDPPLASSAWTCLPGGLHGWIRHSWSGVVLRPLVPSSGPPVGPLLPFTVEDLNISIGSSISGTCTIHHGSRSGIAPGADACVVLPYSALQVVPEPATWALLGTGLLGLGGVALRRRHGAA